ncbi:hypothetical protein BE1S18E01_12850 [Acinetobacter sp. BEC1-S18-ESBL-01]|jgi:hypothetical protein|uniref:Uncharacterized protein n=5 Tax=Acinetobacter TaxID=469 RepID=F0KHQ5_ACIP2|nr:MULTISPECIES: hypothetical protein [Acinetobacter]YP_004995882.1 hypothetical protein BDGL_001614 [Acinetobacter pittii PHEA-2]AMO40330.1 hypothetical protein A0J50_06490 [Acinetobacter sp. DUT-2]ADY82200.1 hypothetical protein BDGL_001614 [Acinetobacter pittii PHEA-2]ENW11719.1 hypothetical protein F930_01674 [Acinetobacter pittii ANC 3678]EXE92445.1 hypothetical protein J588_1086 [Acinetobacter sp. 1578804]EYT26666.1 hypothetical protein J622_01601 [Acinetobacter sp. 1564232]
MLKTIVEFKFDDYQLYDQKTYADEGGILVQKTEDIAQYIFSILKNRYHLNVELYSESWGWEIEIPLAEITMYLGISVYEEYSNGFAIFISPNTPILRKFLFRKIDITHHIMVLQNYINIILKSHPGIYDVMWWEENEFRCVATN